MADLEFDHSCPACERTYATLAVYHHEMTTDEITRHLGIEPDWIIEKGERRALNKVAPSHGWFLTTRDVEQSLDVSYHVFSLLRQLPNGAPSLYNLRLQGATVRVDCFWSSRTGNGGFRLSSSFMDWLAEYQVDLSFDIWIGTCD